MRTLLELQDEEQGTLLAYLDKMHYPLWVTQFYENIKEVTEAIVNAAAEMGVGTLELRYSPLIHTYAGLTVRQSILAVLSGMNHASRPATCRRTDCDRDAPARAHTSRRSSRARLSAKRSTCTTARG